MGNRRLVWVLVLVPVLGLAACGGGGGGGDGDDDGDPTGDGGGTGGDGGGTGSDAGVDPQPVCVPACGVAADCASGPPGSIIDTDNYACDDGVCRWLGCLSTAECTATFGMATYTCEQAFGSPTPTCWPICSTAAQCAVPNSPTLGADNYACDGGKCRWLGCNDTAECTAANGAGWTCAALGGSTLKNCLRTCTTPANCAQPSAPYDADNYTCENNLCLWQGCNSTAECASVDPDWVCHE